MKDNRAASICKKLSSIGIKPIRRTLSYDIFDPTIDITDKLYVQVGDDYVVIVMQDPAGMVHFFEASEKVSDILNSLNEALKLLKITEEVWNLKR